MIRTIYERLRTDTKILISKGKSGISNILFALRSEKGSDGKSAFERQNGRKPNTEKSRMIEKCILDQDPQIDIEPEDFSEEADSTILVRERVRGTKLEGAFKKVKGQFVGESTHTVTILPKTGRQFVYSKRDVAASDKKASGSKVASNSSSEQSGSQPTNKRKASEEKEESVNKEQKMEKQVKQKTTPASKMGLFPQGEPTTNNENEIQIKREENSTEETPKQQLQPGNSSSDNEEEESIQPNNSEEATQMPIKGSIKWERPRTSARVTKKLDRWAITL